MQNEYKHYRTNRTITLEPIFTTNFMEQKIPWNELWKNTFYSYIWPENNILYLLLHYATRTNDQIYKSTNQKHLESPNCKLCVKTENITHLYIDCKGNKKFWKYFQKHYQTLTQKQPLWHILTIWSLSLSPKTNKLTLTVTTTILTTYGKQETNYNLMIQSFPPLTW